MHGVVEPGHRLASRSEARHFRSNDSFKRACWNNFTSQARAAATRAEGKDVHARDQLKRMMAEDPEIHESLERVRKAAALVADIQAQKAAFDEEAAAARNASPADTRRQEQRQAQRAASRGANEDVLRAADELERAKAAFTEASAERDKWATAVDEEVERIESGKAGAIGAIAASAASLPFMLASPGRPVELATSVAAVFVTGLLFGVTYRYAVRQDQNIQLKGGVVAAFGLARGGALAEGIIKAHSTTFPDVETTAAAALLCGQSVLAIAFAATALEQAFLRGALKPFGVLTSQKS